MARLLKVCLSRALGHMNLKILSDNEHRMKTPTYCVDECGRLLITLPQSRKRAMKPRIMMEQWSIICGHLHVKVACCQFFILSCSLVQRFAKRSSQTRGASKTSNT